MQQIRNELNRLTTARNALDRFLTRFLEEFETKMNYESTDSPYWRLYKDKMKERVELSNQIKSLEYQLKKVYNGVRT